MFIPILAWDSPLAIGLIALLALLFFGHKLPQLARSLGMSVNEFKKGVKDGEADADEEADAEKKAESAKIAEATKKADAEKRAEAEVKK